MASLWGSSPDFASNINFEFKRINQLLSPLESPENQSFIRQISRSITILEF